MIQFITSYFAFEVFIVIVALAATWWVRRQRKKLRRDRVPEGYVRTDEVFTDPTTGVVQRVWYHPGTGDRFYETVRKDPQQE